MITKQVKQELRNLSERSKLAETERNKRTQAIESLEDFDLLVENEDLIRLQDVGALVYYRKDNEKIRLFGASCGGDETLGVFIDIPLNKLKIEKGEIVNKEYQSQFFYLDEKLKQILERTGMLY